MKPDEIKKLLERAKTTLYHASLGGLDPNQIMYDCHELTRAVESLLRENGSLRRQFQYLKEGGLGKLDSVKLALALESAQMLLNQTTGERDRAQENLRDAQSSIAYLHSRLGELQIEAEKWRVGGIPGLMGGESDEGTEELQAPDPAV